ncbi:MAG: hypothetical protein VKJ06_07740 [Vampirovibrionales bacterium]|nr:hypothetical protein [Vampirovibrionales bacterium]
MRASGLPKFSGIYKCEEKPGIISFRVDNQGGNHYANFTKKGIIPSWNDGIDSGMFILKYNPKTQTPPDIYRPAFDAAIVNNLIKAQLRSNDKKKMPFLLTKLDNARLFLTTSLKPFFDRTKFPKNRKKPETYA